IGSQTNRSTTLAPLHAVNDHRQQQNRPADDVLVESVDVLQVHRVFDDRQDQYAGDHVTNHADAATEGNTAKHAGGDYRQLETLADHRLAGRHARRENHPGKRPDHAMHGKDDDLRTVDIHPREQRGFAIAAYGHGVAAVGGVVEQPAEENEAQDGDQDWHWYAEQLPAAEHEEALIHHTDGLAVGKDIGQAADDLHGRQRGDQRIDTQLGDHDAVDQPHCQAHRERGGNTEEYALGIAHHHSRHDPGAGNDRPHREVEMPRRQAVQHGAGSDTGG